MGSPPLRRVRYTLAGGAIASITAMDDSEPHFSPGGTTLVCTTFRLGGVDVVWIELSSGAVTQLAQQLGHERRGTVREGAPGDIIAGGRDDHRSSRSSDQPDEVRPPATTPPPENSVTRETDRFLVSFGAS